MNPPKVSWHPGWRYFQLKGDLLAALFLEALADAAREAGLEF